MGNNKSEKEVEWYKVYHELAKLLADIDGEKLYKKCINSEEFQKEHKWFNSFKEETQKQENKERELNREIIRSLDPMHVFASFNGFRMSPKSRTDRINSYFNLLGKENIDKEINFTGCPSPIMIKLIAVREEEHQKRIWESFKEAIKCSKKKLNDDFINFDKLKECYGITIESFTVLLFWIDSKNFLPLDKNTLALFETNNKSVEYSSWKKYKDILIKEPTNIYQIVAKMAWKCTNELSEDKDDLENFGITKCPNKSLKIIAIKPLSGCNEDFLKGLKEDEVYLFDKAYTVDNTMKSIEYDKKKDIQLFNQDNLQININAIVGKNGTGKSTLVELLLACINNIIHSTYQCPKESKKNITKIEELKVELIFENLFIYKIIIDKEIFIYKLSLNEQGIYKEGRKQNIKYFDLEKLFYNILVNYSMHSLNTDSNNWLNAHFYNDCDTPIVLEPFRKNGNINIQKEEKRVKKRLLENLLNPDETLGFRKLTQLKAEKFSFEIPKTEDEKFKGLYQNRILKKLYTDNNVNIVELSTNIENFIQGNDKLNIKNLLPPEFLKTDIILENNIRFSTLSSGEKQKIYSINSILYHIQRLDKEKKYQHINLILDEIELYFHPELQRTYINDIIEAIKKVGTENILGINITFITHSPFILSDIPESKILFLDKESKDIKAKTVPKDNGIQTFGANIHTLLSDSFFMDNGLMGEFAKGKINEIKEFYEKVIEEKKTDENIEFYNKNKTKFEQIQSIVGEPFLKIVLKNYLDEIQDILLEEKAQDLDIEKMIAIHGKDKIMEMLKKS